MAKRSFQVATFTPTATADTTNFAATTFMYLSGGNATQQLNIIEIYEGGQATSSAVNIMQLARVSTVATTPTALAAPNSDGPLSSNTQALATAPISCWTATGFPQRSAATIDARLNLTFNAFGGIVRWQAAPGEEWGIIGNAVSSATQGGPAILSAFTGGSVGLMGAHIIYEPI